MATAHETTAEEDKLESQLAVAKTVKWYQGCNQGPTTLRADNYIKAQKNICSLCNGLSLKRNRNPNIWWNKHVTLNDMVSVMNWHELKRVLKMLQSV